MKPIRVYLKILHRPLLFLFLTCPAFAQPQDSATITKIVDGDTFWLRYQGKEQKVRLIGIDTLEVSYNPKAKMDMAKIDVRGEVES